MLSQRSQELLNTLLSPQSGSGVSPLTTTNTTDLLRLGAGLPNLQVLPIDKLPSPIEPGSYVINQDTSSGGGTHWMGLYYGPSQTDIVFFDPFGVAIDPRILKFAKSSGKRLAKLNTQAQALSEASCGYWVIYFLKHMHRGFPLQKFLSRLDGEDQDKNEKMLQKYFRL